MLAAGDELIVKDGYYSLSQNGSLSLYTDNGNPIARSGQMPAGIDAHNPTIVRRAQQCPAHPHHLPSSGLLERVHQGRHHRCTGCLAVRKLRQHGRFDQ